MPDPLVLNLTVYLKLSEVAKQRARLAGQAIRLGLKRSQAIVHTAGFGFRPVTVGRLSGEPSAERDDHDAREGTRSHIGEE